MRAIPTHQLLDGWEAFRDEPPPLRAAGLAALLSGQPLDAVVRWSVARRDDTLFDFRTRMFGDRLDAVVSCPRCAEPLEMELELSHIAPPRTRARQSSFQTIRVGNRRIRCREPNTEDLLALGAASDETEARSQLIARCVECDDADLRERAAALMSQDAPHVQLELTCPSCGHAWQTPFDIAAFVWSELDGWAQRTLHEIHLIAGAYGWSERDILQLSARRRRAYVEMI